MTSAGEEATAVASAAALTLEDTVSPLVQEAFKCQRTPCCYACHCLVDKQLPEAVTG